MKIKQIYVPYWEWEDWLNGMWGPADDENSALKMAIEFTGDHVKYGAAMRDVVQAWPRCMLNALTNSAINQRAFLGHCAVCFRLKIPEYITRMAWGRLTNEQRKEADRVAQETINEWKREYVLKNPSLYKDMGTAVLF